MALNNFFFILFCIPFIALLALIQIFRNKAIKHDCPSRDDILAKVQLGLIFLVSVLFAGIADWRFALCLLVVSAFTYCMGYLVRSGRRRKSWLVVSIAALVSVLGFFKYTNFFIDSFTRIFGFTGVVLNIMLPLGISFYIFTAISYLMDVYRGKYEAEHDFLDFMVFMTFFPKVTSGPIIRGSEMLPQIKDYRGIKSDAFLVGIQIFVFGLFKKIVLADRLSVFVNDVWYAPTAFATGTVVLGVLSYALQIYFDFSGYSDMAIGLSKILGFDFSANFNLPYLATNMSDFWKRWHISLSSWFRDYLYFPLGGSRKGMARTYFNLFLVMAVSGLWHGAGVTFIVWGLLHGLGSCIHKLFAEICKKHNLKAEGKVTGILSKLGRIMLTFVFVTLCWIPFRSEDMHKTMMVLTSLFTWHAGIVQPYTWSFFAMGCYLIGVIAAYIKKHNTGSKDVNGFYFIMDLSKFWSQVCFFVFCGITVLFAYFGNTAFIYGAF